uniref:Pre-mRNA polyadenylation factor Fip1 domain-containing protein n=1 Tax=Auxenochlorella protothecoides TaxID=3075 RepID=A0A1D2A676_AUXPR
MADDEFEALYGTSPAPAPGAPIHQASSRISAEIRAPKDDGDLFDQLYGAPAPPDEATTCTGTTWAQEDPSPSSKGDAQAPPPLPVPEEGEDSDDDLMITLDENATAYEPAAPRYTTQSGVIPGVGPPAGAHSFRDHPATKHEAPEVPGLFPSSAPPTYNQGYGVQPNRPAIGGVPRSAIPGLGGGPAQRGWQSANAPNAGLPTEEPAFQSEAKPGQPIKLPGQTRVTAEEYREFLSLGHGEIFSLDIDRVVDAPWRIPGIDPSDFFNYGLNQRTWKEYTARIEKFRQEFTMQNRIQTLDQALPGRQEATGATRYPKSAPSAASSVAEAMYRASVTSERPARVTHGRSGSPWDHIIVLTDGLLPPDPAPVRTQAAGAPQGPSPAPSAGAKPNRQGQDAAKGGPSPAAAPGVPPGPSAPELAAARAPPSLPGPPPPGAPPPPTGAQPRIKPPPPPGSPKRQLDVRHLPSPSLMPAPAPVEGAPALLASMLPPPFSLPPNFPQPFLSSNPGKTAQPRDAARERGSDRRDTGRDEAPAEGRRDGGRPRSPGADRQEDRRDFRFREREREDWHGGWPAHAEAARGAWHRQQDRGARSPHSPARDRPSEARGRQRDDRSTSPKRARRADSRERAWSRRGAGERTLDEGYRGRR